MEYNIRYVNRRKRRIRAAIIGGISTVVVASLSIVAFLGRFVGTFTVSLDTGTVKLTLAEESAFLTSTSFLRVNNLAPFEEYTYTWFNDEYSEDELDNDISNYKIGYHYASDGTTIKNVKFFKYTFYLKNVGSTKAFYDCKIRILESKASNDKRKLDDTLRVMVYRNPLNGSHNKKIYGKATRPRTNEQGELDYRPPISMSEEMASYLSQPFPGYVDDTFVSGELIAQYKRVEIAVSEVTRYTLVTWLEGYMSGTEAEENAPIGATIKLGVEINAYEN